MARIFTREQPIEQFYGFTTAALGATATAYPIPEGVRDLMLNGTAAFQMQLGPAVKFIGKTTDGELTYTDYTTEATDLSTSTSVDLGGLVFNSNDYWYVACTAPFGGVVIDVDSTNSAAGSVTVGAYWSGKAWTAVTLTDGTAAGGISLAQDGNITWTTPSNWARLNRWGFTDLYVMRFQPDTASYDATVTLDSVVPLVTLTTYPAGLFSATTDYTFSIDRTKIGSMTFTATGGASTVSVTCIK